MKCNYHIKRFVLIKKDMIENVINEMEINNILGFKKENNPNIKRATMLDHYINYLNNKSSQFFELDKAIVGKSKIKGENMTNQEIQHLLQTNKTGVFMLTVKYNVQQLKSFAKCLKIKSSGNKNELVFRIYSHVKLSGHILIIQKIFRGYIQRRFNAYHGPALFKRELCTNFNDFLTMDDMKDLPFLQFFSYKDIDGFIYGFDITSLYNLIQKTEYGSIKNPYNRNKIPSDVNICILNIIRLSKVLKVPLTLKIQDVAEIITQQKNLEMKIIELFQNINALGNYGDSVWFTSLNRTQIIRFIKELHDIWDYRAQLTLQTKILICPPTGELFRNFNYYTANNTPDVAVIQQLILPVLEKLVNTGMDTDSKSLGAFYVLGALTIVNPAAALSIPWLYQSFNYY